VYLRVVEWHAYFPVCLSLPQVCAAHPMHAAYRGCECGRSDDAGRALVERQEARLAAVLAAVTSTLASFAAHVRGAADGGSQLLDFPR
jgi:hypothetical protein